MNKKVCLWLISFVVLLLMHVPLKGNCYAAPAVSNESVFKGVVNEYAIVSSYLVGIEPEQTLYRLTVRIETSGSVGGGPDFLREKIGQDIRFLSKGKLSPDLFGERIKAKARYRGDERGGVYWISDIELIK